MSNLDKLVPLLQKKYPFVLDYYLTDRLLYYGGGKVVKEKEVVLKISRYMYCEFYNIPGLHTPLKEGGEERMYVLGYYANTEEDVIFFNTVHTLMSCLSLYDTLRMSDTILVVP